MIRGTTNSTRIAAIIFRNHSHSLSLIVLLAVLAAPVYSAGDNYPAGAHSAAMSGTAVMLRGFWPAWHNQAALGYCRNIIAGIHHENRFLVPELALSFAGLAVPTSSGTFGISWTRFGYTLYNENKFGLALGKSFHERFAAGLQFDYLSTHIADETGNAGTVAIEAGILAEPLNRLVIGVHVYNPTASAFRKLNRERSPVILRMGAGYHFDERLFFGLETEKELEIKKARFRCGMEYLFNDYIYIRTGLSVQYHVQHSFGLGLKWQDLQADLAFSFQQVLGYTPHLSLLYVIR